MKGVKGGRGKEERGKEGRISWALGTASLWAPRNVNHKLGILEFNITIADIHTGARFPADCTNRADVAAADPRNVFITRFSSDWEQGQDDSKMKDEMMGDTAANSTEHRLQSFYQSLREGIQKMHTIQFWCLMRGGG